MGPLDKNKRMGMEGFFTENFFYIADKFLLFCPIRDVYPGVTVSEIVPSLCYLDCICSHNACEL